MLNGAGTTPSAAAPSTNAAPPVVNVNPNPQPGGTASRGGNGAQPAQSRGGNGGTGAQPAGNRGGTGAQQPAPSRNPAAAAPAPATTGTPVDAATQTAVQQAIQTIDAAQVKAVASKDVSGLSDGATSDFATGQKNVTQDLIDNDVTQIQLVNIEWGAATIDNGTVTATAYETWGTTYADGTTEQSRDRNVYTLVQQDGSWKVQADEHPDAAPTGLEGFPGGASSFPGIPGNLLPPGFPNPFQNPAPRGQSGTNPSAPVQVQP
jgi:hypothetical protein